MHIRSGTWSGDSKILTCRGKRSHNGCGLSDCLATRWACEPVVVRRVSLSGREGGYSVPRSSLASDAAADFKAGSQLPSAATVDWPLRVAQPTYGRQRPVQLAGWGCAGGAQSARAAYFSRSGFGPGLQGPHSCYRVDDRLADQAVFVMALRRIWTAPSFLHARSSSADGRVDV